MGSRRIINNDELGDTLERVADLLAAQDANRFRVAAYRRGAETVRKLDEAIAERLERAGRAGLEELPGIGPSIASALEELVHTGRLRMLDRLEGLVSPEDLFTTVPGIGEDLAHRIHDQLGIESLEELELAAHDGRLATVRGFGERRVRGVREALASILSRSARRRSRARQMQERGLPSPTPAERPSVAALLDFDAEYRRRADAGQLPQIAPRRFNPSGAAWLPVLHGEREGWSLTALYSNTALAHRLGRTHNWVVVYFERDGHEGQHTVVTERNGILRGQRVVRGREDECIRAHASRDPRGDDQATAPM